jgi:hypothetical protein
MMLLYASLKNSRSGKMVLGCDFRAIARRKRGSSKCLHKSVPNIKLSMLATCASAASFSCASMGLACASACKASEFAFVPGNPLVSFYAHTDIYHNLSRHIQTPILIATNTPNRGLLPSHQQQLFRQQPFQQRPWPLPLLSLLLLPPPLPRQPPLKCTPKSVKTSLILQCVSGNCKAFTSISSESAKF